MPRVYRSALRERQSALTQTQIFDAAYGLFVSERGYTRTTMSQIAAAAGVSTQTLYNVVGAKAALLKRVYDVHLAGDEEPVPMVDRPEFRALAELTDARAYLRGYARVGMVLLQRVGPLVAIVLEGAAAGDEDLRALVATTGRERMFGAGGAVARAAELGTLRPDLTREQAAEIVWTLNGYPIWDLLVRQRGWTPEAYAEFVGRAMADAILVAESA